MDQGADGLVYRLKRGGDYVDYPDQDLPYLGLLKGLAEQTTAHGIPHIHTARGILKPASWGLISICFSAGLVWHLSAIFTTYFRRPIDVRIEFPTTKELIFPAVTICNMNPMKKSAILRGNPELSDLLIAKDSSRKRKRKRRSLDLSCTDPGQIHHASGLCFGLASPTAVFYNGLGGAVDLCNNQQGGGLVIINTQDKWEFIKNSPIFDALSEEEYFVNIKRTRWHNVAPLDLDLFHAFAPGQPDGLTNCVVANRTNDHLWSNSECSNLLPRYAKLALCQQLVKCPWPVYHDDVTNMDVCYFLFDGNLTMTNMEARSVCQGYDWDARLATLDTAEKVNHVISAGILEATIVDDYWIYLENCTWGSSRTPASWLNWAGPQGDDNDCGMGHVDQGHKWTNQDCSSGSVKALALCEWRATSISSDLTLSPATFEPSTVSLTSEVQTAILGSATLTNPSGYQSTEEVTNLPTTLTPEKGASTELIPSTVVSYVSSIGLSSLVSTSDGNGSSIYETSQPSTPPEDTSAGTPQGDTSAGTSTDPLSAHVGGVVSTKFTIPPTTTPEPGATAPPPRKVEGSQYEERIAVREDFKKQDKALEVISDLPLEEKEAMGYTSTEFLLDCQYNGYGCNIERDFYRFYSLIHGNCYIFNSGWNSSSIVQKSQKAGRRYGLKLILNIGQDEYTDQFGEEAGARIVLHPQDKMPFPEDEGILARPGFLTSIGARQVTVSRLTKPYGDCVDLTDNHVNLSKNVYEELYPVNYSRNACQKTCFQYYVIKECGCADPYYPKEGKAFPFEKVSSCDPNNITEDDCKYDVNRRYMRDELDCDCPNSCKDHYFLPQVSTATWPSNVQLARIKNLLGTRVPDMFNDASDPWKYRRNLLKIEVYFEELSLEWVSERPAYNEIQFISNIGGAFGLWFGASLMTSVEFLEFFIDILVHFLLHRKQKRDQHPSSSCSTSSIGEISSIDTPYGQEVTDSAVSLHSRTSPPGDVPYYYRTSHTMEVPHYPFKDTFPSRRSTPPPGVRKKREGTTSFSLLTSPPSGPHSPAVPYYRKPSPSVRKPPSSSPGGRSNTSRGSSMAGRSGSSVAGRSGSSRRSTPRSRVDASHGASDSDDLLAPVSGK